MVKATGVGGSGVALRFGGPFRGAGRRSFRMLRAWNVARWMTAVGERPFEGVDCKGL